MLYPFTSCETKAYVARPEHTRSQAFTISLAAVLLGTMNFCFPRKTNFAPSYNADNTKYPGAIFNDDEFSGATSVRKKGGILLTPSW
ncbi:hypothetical protein OUZ56_027772 [Daphnia magna]|uniref:Uncharacterized protein n=1 Tax=Daphnia magna TaxID=35525 RepID=A0ABR0B2I3_9CRUS|nr:hypothetical protein OUZ56_027772 [Daphnia magna]